MVKVYLPVLLFILLVSCAKSGSDDLPTSITIDYKVTASSETFGSVQVGTESDEIEFKFENKGNTPLGGCTEAGIEEGQNTEFEITKDNCGTSALAMHATCTVLVKAKPTSPGTKAAVLVRRCIGGSKGIPMFSPLSALAIYPAFSSNLATYDFGDVSNTTSTAPVVFTITNTGTEDASGCTDPAFTGGDTAEFSVAANACNAPTLAIGDSCTVSVVATPSAIRTFSTTLRRSCTVGGDVDISLAVNGI